MWKAFNLLGPAEITIIVTSLNNIKIIDHSKISFLYSFISHRWI